MSQVALDHASLPPVPVVLTAGLSAPYEHQLRQVPDARNAPDDGRPHAFSRALPSLDPRIEARALPFVGMLVDIALQLVAGDVRFVDKLVRAGAVGLLETVEEADELADHPVALEGEVRSSVLCTMLDALLGRGAVDVDLRLRADALVDLHVACPIPQDGARSAPSEVPTSGALSQEGALIAADVVDLLGMNDGSLPTREDVAKRLRARTLDAAIDAAIDALPDQERTAIVHTYRHGYDVQELATALRVSVVRAVQLRTRGFEHIRQRVA